MRSQKKTYQLPPRLIEMIQEVADETGVHVSVVLSAISIAGMEAMMSGKLNLDKYKVEFKNSLKYEYTLDLEAMARDFGVDLDEK
jgi:hypothetical protein